MIQIVHLSSKGQLVVPLGVRRVMRLRPGSRLALRTEGANLVLRPLPRRPYEAFFAIFHGAEIEGERRAMKRAERKRDRKLGSR